MLHSLGFNHASVWCGWCAGEVSVDVSVDSNMYVGYTHLKHVHIQAIKTRDNKMMMWVSYNGIAAF